MGAVFVSNFIEYIPKQNFSIHDYRKAVARYAMIKKKQGGIYVKDLKGKWRYLVLIIGIVILVPILMDYLILGNQIQSNATNGEWIGFFGGYFGSIIGGIITLAVFWGTVWDNKKQSEKEEKLKLFETLITDAALIGETQNRLLTTPPSDAKYKDLVYELNKKALEVKMRLEIAQEKDMYTGTEKPIRLLDDMLDNMRILQISMAVAEEEIEEQEDNEEERKGKTDDKKEDGNNKLDIEKMTKFCKTGFIFQIKQFILENDK